LQPKIFVLIRAKEVILLFLWLLVLPTKGQIVSDSSNVSHRSDSLSKLAAFKNLSSLNKDKKKNNQDTLTADYKNIFDVLEANNQNKISFSWYLDNNTFDLRQTIAFDSSLYFNNLIIPGSKKFAPFTYLGNMGSPIINDHFFDRTEPNNDFIFSYGYNAYQQPVLERKQFNVKRPHTLLEYSTGGKKKSAEQNLHVIHTQNVNKYFNVGLQYDYFSTKGIYENQLTRNNDFTLFSSYFKDRISAQGTFAYTYIRNNENGGLEDDRFIQDTIMEPDLIPFNLSDASNEFRKRSFAGFVGYDLIVKAIDNDSIPASKRKKSILNAKLIIDANRFSKVYKDAESDSSYYQHFYINTSSTFDSIYLLTYQTTLLVELSQISKFPGIPGLRAWVSNISGSYYYLKPEVFISSNDNERISTNLFGIGAYSKSPYLSYSAAARFYINGYRAADKELFGQMTISPWKSLDMPYVSGEISITDKEPSIFMKEYFSNHYKWDNNFDKESRFRISAKFGADKVKFEAGYNLLHIVNYTYFDTLSLPAQEQNVTVTSAYIQKRFSLGWFNMVGRLIWQASTSEAINLPVLSGFGSIFVQFPVVKNALTVQLGVSGFYRTKFYAYAYNPALGVYYNQKEKEIGNYPFVEAFLNAKWKRTNLFVKVDHLNMGYLDNQYYTALHYPYNPRMLKFGLSWMFYD
jgi:hypothetical protein